MITNMLLLDKIKEIFGSRNQRKDVYFDSTIDHNNEITNKIAPDSIEIKEDYVRSGSNFTRTLICVDFEPLLSQEDIRRLSELSETITITQHLEVYETAKVRAELSRSIDQNSAKLNEEKLSENLKADANAEIESNKALLNELARNKERMFMMQVIIHIVGKSKDELERITNIV